VRIAYLLFNTTDTASNLGLFIPITPPPGYPTEVNGVNEDINALLQHPNASAEPFFYMVAGYVLTMERLPNDTCHC
jgi:hypothetical protein